MVMYGTVREVPILNRCSSAKEVYEITSRTMVQAAVAVRAQSVERFLG